MKGLIGSTPFLFVIFGIIMFYLDAIRGKKKHSDVKHSVSDDGTSENCIFDQMRRENLEAIQKICESHTEYTAEIVKIRVFYDDIWTWRRVKVGDPVTVSYDTKRGIAIVKTHNIRVAKFDYRKETTGLAEVFEQGKPFEAYLGGRDINLINVPVLDVCSIIFFYKLPGIPPTKVNLHP